MELISIIKMLKRLAKELTDINREAIPNVSAGPSNQNDLTKWEATIMGPSETPYEGGIF